MMAAMHSDNGVSLATLLDDFFDSAAIPDCFVAGIQSDSRKVVPGDLFLACAGETHHGLKFAAQAVHQGAVAVVFEVDEKSALETGVSLPVPMIALPELGKKVGEIAARFYGEPSRAMRVVGITGTNGKTSCCQFLAQALAGQLDCGTIGTLGWGFSGKLDETQHTTPEPVELNRILASLKEEGAKAVAMEASSHALSQSRTAGVRFEGALFTNFSRDHLDYYASFDDYVAAKLLLLKSPGLSFAVFNLDDPTMGKAVNATPQGVKKWGYSKQTELKWEGIELVSLESYLVTDEGLQLTIGYKDCEAALKTSLIGQFNLDNLLSVATILLAMGFGFDDMVSGLKQIRAIEGRMERFTSKEKPVVVVDYAHTPDALEKALAGVRPHCVGKLKVVFGCGGDRDQGKRPQMGAVAGRLADEIYLTDDNPRHESGDQIINEILASGITGAVVERDRRRAIELAIDCSSPDDLILVAGKGHETTQMVGDLELPFSDRAVVKSLLAGARQR